MILPLMLLCYMACLQVQLYFMILERLGKCVEALEVVRGPLGGEGFLIFFVKDFDKRR